VAECPAKAVGFKLADECRAGAETGNTDDGIGRGPARHLDRRAHRVIDRLRAPLIDQCHGALAHAVRQQKIVVRAGNHIDDGIADAQDIVARGC
jgi:hypothetical protein